MDHRLCKYQDLLHRPRNKAFQLGDLIKRDSVDPIGLGPESQGSEQEFGE